MDDTTYPWLILVPMREDLCDLHDVANNEDIMLMTEIRSVSRALAAIHNPAKLNVAALGNQVPQLHIHIIARFTGDDAWPGPVWGKAPRQPYEPAARDTAISRLRDAISNNT